MFKKLFGRLSGIASAINGTDSAPSAEASDDTQVIDQQPAVDHQQSDGRTSASTTDGSILNNAIDNRDQAVRLIVDSFRSATGTKAREFECLTVIVAYHETPFDPLLHAWADEEMTGNLRRELDNALLSAVGARQIDLKFVFSPEIDREQCREIVPDCLYVSWSGVDIRPRAVLGEGWISIVADTGSLLQPIVQLDPEAKNVYRIGRGAISRRSGSIRRNDIIINDRETDPALRESNECVSSSHADIVVRNGRYCLRAADGGCRAKCGSATKLIHDDKIIELTDTATLMPLSDGDMIELGKSVTLLFSTSRPY